MAHMPTSSLGTLSDQAFPYTCLGTEGDSFTLTLPAARYDTNYIAKVDLLYSPTTQYICNSPPSSYTVTTIQIITGQAVSAGDILGILITERTS